MFIGEATISDRTFGKRCSISAVPINVHNSTAMLGDHTFVTEGGGYYYSTRKNMEHPTPKYSGSNCICTHKLFYEIVGRNVKKYTSVINSFSYDFVIGASCPLVVQNI